MASLLQRILPKEDSFYQSFIAQASNVVDGVKALVALFENFQNVSVQVEVIKGIEHKGDTMTYAVTKRLNQVFITPFDHEDIYRLSTKIDDVLDLTDAVARRLVTYRITSLRPGVVELSHVLLEATNQILLAVQTLEKENHILDRCRELSRLEKEGDRISRALIADLFETEKDAALLIKWKEIIETLETAIDKCEDVANVIEAVMIKSGR